MYEALMFREDALLLLNNAFLLREHDLLPGAPVPEVVELLNHEHLFLLEQAHDLLRVSLEELDLGLASVLFEGYDLDLVLLLQHLYLIAEISILNSSHRLLPL